MLLFSTLLSIKDTITPDEFISLVLEWNENSIHEENRIPNIDWNEEHNVRYGNSNLWIEFLEYPEEGILAVRHEKITDNGVVWDSDFIFNYLEQKLAIQLDRTYSEEALTIDGAFSTPHFITLLIEHGFIKDDRDLPVLRTQIHITDENMEACHHLFSGERRYKLPVVLVTKTQENKDPVSISWLASRLKGAAHVLVEEDIGSCAKLRESCCRSEDPFGAVRIFYPSESVRRKKYHYRIDKGNEQARLEKVVRNVIQYGISQRIGHLYTWQGVSGALISEQLKNQIAFRQNAESARKKAEDDIDLIYETYDEELRTLNEKVEELTKANEALRYENQGLRSRLSGAEAKPIIYQGDEDEFYNGEIRDMVLGALDEALTATEKATRKADVLEDILENNPYHHLSEDRKQRIKALFKGYKNLTGAMRQELLSLGFEITETGKHYKITYKGDQRYMVTVGKTPSDNRAGINNAAMISKTML